MNDSNFCWKTLISLIGIDVGCIVYFVLLFTPLNTQSTFFLPLEVLMLIYLYQGAKKYYQFFRILEFILKYEYQSKLADLFITLLTIAHSIVSRLLFSHSCCGWQPGTVQILIGALHFTYPRTI